MRGALLEGCCRWHPRCSPASQRRAPPTMTPTREHGTRGSRGHCDRSALKTCRTCPLSVQAIGTKQLEQMNVDALRRLREDAAERVPSRAAVRPSSTRSCAAWPADAVGEPLRVPSRPSACTSIPSLVTTIDGNLPLHIYDIERVGVALRPAGYPVRRELGVGHHPHHHQQTGPDRLSRAATTSKATPSLTAVPVTTLEGFINIPLTDWAAVRLVGWDQKDAGYIDNVHGVGDLPHFRH